MWDDRYLSNADFAFIYPFFTNDEVNRLEQKFLEQIQYLRSQYRRYNVTVKASLYAKYYYELRALYKDRVKEFPVAALSNVDARNLEIRSHKYADVFSDIVKQREKLSRTVGSPATFSREKQSTGFVVLS